MIKSIFTRYIVAFMSIIIVSFAILAFIVGSMITTYSNDEKKSINALRKCRPWLNRQCLGISPLQ